MSGVLLYRLRMNREAILQDLEPEQVMNYLYQEDVLDYDNYEEVRDKGSRKKQAELLLSYVERDSSAVQKMIDALEGSSQRHLACILNKALPDEVQLSKGGFVVLPSNPLRRIVPYKCTLLYYFTLSNARQFYSSRGDRQFDLSVCSFYFKVSTIFHPAN